MKFNRVAFRLPWLRARNFPGKVKIIHIFRDKERSGRACVSRVQDIGRDDGQANPNWKASTLEGG